MEKDQYLKNVSEMILKAKSSIDEMKKSGEVKSSEVLTTFSDCLNSIVNKVQELEARIEDIEQYLDEEDFEDGIESVKCPFCGYDIEIDEEFIMADEPKLVCQNCNKEIEVLTQPCGCGCGCEEEECEDSCCEDDGCGHSAHDCGCGGDKKDGKK